MTGYDFHPEARLDLDEIWEFIRTDNLDAADRVIAEILSAIRALVPFLDQGHKRPEFSEKLLRENSSRDFLRITDRSVRLHELAQSIYARTIFESVAPIFASGAHCNQIRVFARCCLLSRYGSIREHRDSSATGGWHYRIHP